jgi:epoxyqueuosine reductase
MDRKSAASEVKRIALEEGFDRAGIARLTPSSTAGAFTRWLADGRQAGMAYLERHLEIREDPRLLFDGARSILCVAMQYFPRTGEEAPDPESIWPRVARYARGEDYHRFLRAALKRVAARIEERFPGAGTRACVDTAPLLEREWAARAGLGAIGKNTNLLHPEGGSWFLLGEVLLTLDLAPDEPVADLCGECTRCLDACPTGALTAPYELDSRRCISYWTIEHRGEIPEPMRDKLAGWLFGCDICQEVCPWNRQAAPSGNGGFATPPERRGLDLARLLETPVEELRESLRRTPLLRPGVEGLRRNARLLVAAGPGNNAGAPL